MFAEVTDSALNEQQYTDRLRQAASNAGAIVTFTGLVRDYNTEGLIEGISLEHYPGMTESAMKKLLDDAAQRFNVLNAGIVHRVGFVANHQPIVWVGCAASHRQAAFDAAGFIMDMLKKSVPLWKKEHQNGTACWVAAKASDDEAAMQWLKKK